MSDTKDCTVRVIRKTSELEALRERWNELVDASEYPNIFSTWEWASIWWRWYGERELHGELFILLIERNTEEQNGGEASQNQTDHRELAGIFPFYKKRTGLLKTAVQLNMLGYGARPSAEYLGPMIRRGCMEPVCDAAVSFLAADKREWNSIFFEAYSCDDPGTSAFVQKMQAVFPFYTQKDEPRHYIPLPDSYDAYLGTLSSHNRYNKRRRLNIAKSKFAATSQVLDVADIDEWFPIFVDLTEQSRKRLKQPSPYSKKEYGEFQKELLRALIPQKRAEMRLLYFSGEPAAVMYVFLLNGKCYYYQTGMALGAEGSPGDVILQLTLIRQIEMKTSEFDFLRGSEWYKTAYTGTDRETEMLCLFPVKNFAYLKCLLIYRYYRPFRRNVKQLLLKCLPFLKPKDGKSKH
ncbi:MAG: GNAT family N-acetyltransferase [Planctomycetaceae bacterium]|nr:GNAT family N-acetyltransferase [Planctomycetaceae bacterium]